MFTTLITPADLAPRLADPAYVVVDVRHDLARPDRWGEEQYAAGHLPGARFAHIDRDLSAPKTGRNGRHPLPSPDDAAALFGRLGIAPGTQVIAYDQGSGMFAARLWWMLRWLGHDAVAVLNGGFERWTREGRPVSTDKIVYGQSFVIYAMSECALATGDARARAAAERTFELVQTDCKLTAQVGEKGYVERDAFELHVPQDGNQRHFDFLKYLERTSFFQCLPQDWNKTQGYLCISSSVGSGFGYRHAVHGDLILPAPNQFFDVGHADSQVVLRHVFQPQAVRTGVHQPLGDHAVKDQRSHFKAVLH